MISKEENVIPKKIHLIWFGNIENFKFDLNSLSKFMPGYEVKIWSDNDFDWNELCKIPYVDKAYRTQNWAFLSDYLRVKILYEEGGVYLDSDMEFINSAEEIFNSKELVLAFENNATISMGICAAKKGHYFFKKLKEIYESYKGGKFIMGNIIWDEVVKKEIGAKINGRFQENLNKWVIHESKSFSLIRKSKKESILKNQYTIHKHEVTWAPEKYRKILISLITITQSATFLNKVYGVIFIFHRKQALKNFDIYEK